MLAAAVTNATKATMFARVLLALDEDVISLDIPRSEAGSRRSMAFKDAMRDRDATAVLAASIGLVATHRATSPPATMAIMSALQRYTDWVDISLIATPDFMALLRQMLQGVFGCHILPPYHDTKVGYHLKYTCIPSQTKLLLPYQPPASY